MSGDRHSGALRKAAAGGFSLAEVLVVAGVISLLLALTVPSFVSLGPSRKAGIHELAGFLENARAAAVANREERVVAFADARFPNDEMALRAYALFAVEETDPADADGRAPVGTAPADGRDSRSLRRLTPWRTLPKGLVFARGADFDVSDGELFRTLHDLLPARSVPVPAPGTGGPDVSVRPLPCVAFGPDGGVRQPGFAEADALHLGVVEGHLEARAGRVVPTASRKGSGGRNLPVGDCLEIGFYTGRVRILTD